MPKNFFQISAITLLIFGISTAVFAQSLVGETPASGDLVTTPTQSVETATCYDEVVTAVNQKQTNFYISIDTTLQSANLNSESLNYLFKQYRRAFEDIDLILNQAVRNRIQTAEENAACRLYVQERLGSLRVVFVEAYKTYLAQKRGVILNEKYDAVNAELEKIDEDLRSTKDNVAKFNDLLTCFATQCIN